MVKIIKLSSARWPHRKPYGPEGGCARKEVVAYTVSRKVCCTISGARLDPFDVLLDLLKGYQPTGRNDPEQCRFHRETAQRQEKPDNEN